MPRVQLPSLKPAHKLVQAYNRALAQSDQHHVTRALFNCIVVGRRMTVEAYVPTGEAAEKR